MTMPQLDIAKLIDLDQLVPNGIKRFYELHQLYLNKLDTMIEHLEALEK
jgi:hypothetical protein